MADDWRGLLATCGDGFMGDERNVILALRSAPELEGLVGYNEFAIDVVFRKSPPWRVAEPDTAWTEADDTLLMAWLQDRDIRVRNKGSVADCVAVVSKDFAFHPVRDYLDSLKWDGIARLDSWLSDFLGADASQEYLRAVGRRFLISAVARIYRPGCQADCTLVLDGLQGLGKTQCARTLAKKREWFAGSLPDVHSKDAPLQLTGRWIVEIDELKALKGKQNEAVKGFLSQTADTFRPPYSRRTAQFPRQSVFIGTTNESEYLHDKTGNRRYWPVHVTEIDIDALSASVDQLWAESVAAFKQGEQWHLTAEEARLATSEQEQRVHVSDLEAAVGEYLRQYTADTVTSRDVMVYGLRLDPDEAGFTERARRLGTQVRDAIEACGWKKQGRSTVGGPKATVYRRSGQGGQGK
jgi:putative DNA primase/helicase